MIVRDNFNLFIYIYLIDEFGFHLKKKSFMVSDPFLILYIIIIIMIQYIRDTFSSLAPNL